MNPSARLLIVVFFPALLFACGSNCRETVRMGDFEFSQGNYPRAEKLYAEAWAADSLACPDAREKLGNTRRFMRN
jgi:hypothetical protein